MTLKALIFDMDGTFVNTEKWHKKLLTDCLKKEFNKSFPSWLRKELMGMAENATWTKLKKLYDLPGTVEELMSQHYLVSYDFLAKKKLEAIVGFKKLLAELRDKQIPLAVASSSRREVIQLVLGKLEIEDFFTCIVGGDELTVSKPEPDIFLKAAERLQTKPEECLVIEDSHNGVVGAKRANCFCFGFKPWHSNQDLQVADLLIRDYSPRSIKKIMRLF